MFLVWIREHKKPIPSLVDLKKEIDTYMEQYDAKVEAEKQSAKQTEGEADEEGWVTVTRGGKRKGVRQQDVMNETMGSAAKKRVSEKVWVTCYCSAKVTGDFYGARALSQSTFSDSTTRFSNRW